MVLADQLVKVTEGKIMNNEIVRNWGILLLFRFKIVGDLRIVFHIFNVISLLMLVTYFFGLSNLIMFKNANNYLFFLHIFHLTSLVYSYYLIRKTTAIRNVFTSFDKQLFDKKRWAVVCLFMFIASVFFPIFQIYKPDTDAVDVLLITLIANSSYVLSLDYFFYRNHKV